jgi:hypothetical protein
MTIDLHQLALLALLGTAIHWLVARSQIMKWFWDLRWWPVKGVQYWQPEPRFEWDHCTTNTLRILFSDLLACAACSGWWFGLILGIRIHPLHLGPWWLDWLGAGLAGVMVVPILEGVLIWGLETSHIN